MHRYIYIYDIHTYMYIYIHIYGTQYSPPPHTAALLAPSMPAGYASTVSPTYPETIVIPPKEP